MNLFYKRNINITTLQQYNNTTIQNKRSYNLYFINKMQINIIQAPPAFQCGWTEKPAAFGGKL